MAESTEPTASLNEAETNNCENSLTVDFVLAKSKAKDLKLVKKLNCW
jgi:hypothetical protein